MLYKKYGDDYVLRMDKGQDFFTSLKTLCEKEDIRLASVNGIGALSHVELGVFEPEKKSYKPIVRDGFFEIVSCLGNVSMMDGQVYLHIHMCVAQKDGQVFAGHFSAGTIGLTGEIFVHKVRGRIERKYSAELGFNEWTSL